MKKLLLAYLMGWCGLVLHGQPLPTTQLFAFQWTGDSNVVDQAQLLTGFNSEGYNNQPSFIAQDELIFTFSDQDKTQTDIYSLDLTAHEVVPITQTKSSSEYSPQLLSDSWICVRVDSLNLQWLWEYPIDGSDQGEPAWPHDTRVGYYHIIKPDSFVVFITGEPHQLGLTNNKQESFFRFSSNIGRAFQSYGKYVYYLHKLTDFSWYIKSYDPWLNRSQIVTKSLDGVEDFHIMENGDIISAREGQIYKYDQDANAWVPWIDLSVYGLRNITRITTNNKYLVVVEKE